MCYYMETIYYDDPLFREVDATYIIHLESDTKRYADIREQLNLYHPTRTVHIVYNKGFKRCDKPNVSNTVEDLVDVCVYVMNDAQKYKTILLLEDDFMFNPRIREHTKNIDEFVSTHSQFIYRLGCLPSIQVPYNRYTYVGLSLGTHAVLFSKSIREKLMRPPRMDWDLYLNYASPNFMYYMPLCYQLFPQTENQKNWGKDGAVSAMVAPIVIWFMKTVRLDQQVSPGYPLMYAASKLAPIVVLLGCVSYWQRARRR